MARITKRVNRGVPSILRQQIWDIPTVDAVSDGGDLIVSGDIIAVEDSLGRPARHLLIEVTGGDTLEVRFNPTIQLFPPRPKGEFHDLSDNNFWLASGVSFTDTTMQALAIQSGETYNIDRELPVREVELLTVAGVNFRVVVS